MMGRWISNRTGVSYAPDPGGGHRLHTLQVFPHGHRRRWWRPTRCSPRPPAYLESRSAERTGAAILTRYARAGRR